MGLSDAPIEVNPAELKEVDQLSLEEEARAVYPGAFEPGTIGASSGRSEAELIRALEAGEVDAGLELLELLSGDRSRSHDAVIVAGHLAALRPGEGAMLGRLVAQASRDGNEALALAVRHVLGSFGAGDPVRPPPLSEVIDEPEAVRSVLLRGLRAPSTEALGIVWENASSLFKKDLADYGVAGTDRVPSSAPTALGELYRESTRILGMVRTPLFRIGSGEDISIRVALVAPPAVIVSGEVTEVTPELQFHFGAALAASTSENVLLFGSQPEELSTLLTALSVSFGGGESQASESSPRVMRLATFLWETIPARAQRRLSQLCVDPAQLAPEVALDFAQFLLRRAGLVVCGNIRTAIADACQHQGIAVPRSLSDLEKATQSSSAVADLLSLAISPEYAELRFRTSR